MTSSERRDLVEQAYDHAQDALDVLHTRAGFLPPVLCLIVRDAVIDCKRNLRHSAAEIKPQEAPLFNFPP